MDINQDNPAIRAMMKRFANFLSEAAEIGIIHQHHLPANCIMIPMIIITPGSENNFNYDLDILVRDGENPRLFYDGLRKSAEAIRQQLS